MNLGKIIRDMRGVVPRCVVANVIDCNTVLNEFELQSYYCFYFLVNIIGQDTDPPYPLNYVLYSTITVLLQPSWVI